MTKNELIQWLEKYVEVAKRERSLLLARKDVEKEIAEGEELLKRTRAILPKLNRKRKIALGVYSVCTAFLLWVACLSKDKYYIGLAAFAIGWGVIGFLSLRVPAKKQLEKDKQCIREKLPQMQARLKKIDDKMLDVLMDVSIYEQQSVLAEKYMNYQAASKFLDYLKNGRADTLKEAINLYETELYRERMYRENQRHHRQMEDEQLRQTEELKKARREAERAAETAEQAAKQSHRDSQFNLIAGAVIADAAIKEERQRNETPGMHI